MEQHAVEGVKSQGEAGESKMDAEGDRKVSKWNLGPQEKMIEDNEMARFFHNSKPFKDMVTKETI